MLHGRDITIAEVSAPERVVAVVPARDEAERITATIAGIRRISTVHEVIVVDDGSRDATADLARAAGATVVRTDRTRGKGAAMARGAAAAAATGLVHEPLLFLDADLGGSAADGQLLADRVLADDADLVIGTLPARARGGGHGFVVSLSGRQIERRTGWRPTQPLSGQRCVTRPLFEQLLPLARGFGVETRMTIDALRIGARVIEVETEFDHRYTGSGWRDQLHRAHQYRDVLAAVYLPNRFW